jgi:hypothetical protein
MMDLESFTVEEFEAQFDELFERVQNGESFFIIHPDGFKVVITPYDNPLR